MDLRLPPTRKIQRNSQLPVTASPSTAGRRPVRAAPRTQFGLSCRQAWTIGPRFDGRCEEHGRSQHANACRQQTDARRGGGVLARLRGHDAAHWGLSCLTAYGYTTASVTLLCEAPSIALGWVSRRRGCVLRRRRVYRSRRLNSGGRRLCPATGAHNVIRLRPLAALDDVELDLVAFLEAFVAIALDGAVMHEDVRPAFAPQEAKALRVVEPLHRTLILCQFIHSLPRPAVD